MNLREIFDKYGTDKGYKHSYDLIYENIISNKSGKLLEIGIFKGESLLAWKEWLKDGEVYGIDIFTRITPEQVPALQQPGIFWLKGDTLSPEITRKVSLSFDTTFDYIIDDGAHWPEANKLTFRHIKKFLKPNGLYIIEDVWPLEKMSKRELNHDWILENPGRYNTLDNDLFLKELNDSGMEIVRYDNRIISGQPDSYLIVLKNNQKSSSQLPQPPKLLEMVMEDSYA